MYSTVHKDLVQDQREFGLETFRVSSELAQYSNDPGIDINRRQ